MHSIQVSSNISLLLKLIDAHNRTLLNVVQPVSVTAQIFIAGDLYGTYVRIIDNDTSREIQSDSFEIRNMVLEPNKVSDILLRTTIHISF